LDRADIGFPESVRRTLERTAREQRDVLQVIDEVGPDRLTPNLDTLEQACGACDQRVEVGGASGSRSAPRSSFASISSATAPAKLVPANPHTAHRAEKCLPDDEMNRRQFEGTAAELTDGHAPLERRCRGRRTLAATLRRSGI
jgi:hypothetical protein